VTATRAGRWPASCAAGRGRRALTWGVGALALAACWLGGVSGCLYTKAPYFPDLSEQAEGRLGAVEFSTARINPEDGPLTAGARAYRYCESPPCTLVGDGHLHVLRRAPNTWITLDYLRVWEPGQGVVPLTHQGANDGRRVRFDDGREHTGDLDIDLNALGRLYGLNKGDLVGLTLHQSGASEVERYYFERRTANGNGVPDRFDVDVAVGVVPIPEGAADLDPPDGQDRRRWDVGRATFPLAVQLSLGWNTVSREGPLAELLDRVDLVLALAVANFQGLPSGLEAKTAPAFGPGLRFHRVLNLVWYLDLFGEDPVSFPALAISIDESLRVAASLLRTDVIHKRPLARRFRLHVSGGPGSSLADVGSQIVERNTDNPAFPAWHLGFGRVWGKHWTFPQVEGGVTWIPQRNSDDDLVFVQLGIGPRFDLDLLGERLKLHVSPQVAAYQGYLLREDATNESRLRGGVAVPAGVAWCVHRDRRHELTNWWVGLSGVLHLINDFAGEGGWSRYLSTELTVAVEF